MGNSPEEISGPMSRMAAELAKRLGIRSSAIITVHEKEIGLFFSCHEGVMDEELADNLSRIIQRMEKMRDAIKSGSCASMEEAREKSGEPVPIVLDSDKDPSDFQLHGHHLDQKEIKLAKKFGKVASSISKEGGYDAAAVVTVKGAAVSMYFGSGQGVFESNLTDILDAVRDHVGEMSEKLKDGTIKPTELKENPNPWDVTGDEGESFAN